MPADLNKEVDAPGTITIGGHVHMIDVKGSKIPVEVVRAQDRLQDQLVRRLFPKAVAVAEALAAFKIEAFAEIDAFVELVNDKYGARGGAKGNLTLASYDGTLRFQVQVADILRFGTELQAAKNLVDECLNEWTADSAAELRAIVTQAFDVDKEGEINRGRLFTLLRYDIDDERWKRAMQALRDAIVPDGTKRFLRAYHRDDAKDPWRHLALGVDKA